MPNADKVVTARITIAKRIGDDIMGKSDRNSPGVGPPVKYIATTLRQTVIKNSPKMVRRSRDWASKRSAARRGAVKDSLVRSMIKSIISDVSCGRTNARDKGTHNDRDPDDANYLFLHTGPNEPSDQSMQ